jgi:lysozyme family protein
MAFPLIALAAAIMPEVVRLVAGGKAGEASAAISDAVRIATGTDDPVEAKARLAANPQLEAELRTRLAQIAVELQRLQFDAQEKQRAAELAELEARLLDLQNARATFHHLSDNRDPLRWGAPVVSAVVTLIFLISLLVFALPQWFPIADGNKDMLNIVLGALVAAFTAVINFWVGSSQGSRDKDVTVRALQESQTQQAKAALSTQAQQTSAALANQTQATQAALDTMKQAARAPVASPGMTLATSRVPEPGSIAPSKRKTFESVVEVVLQKEGSYSNHPRDKGGPTNFGITYKTYAAFLGKDPAEVSEQEVRELKRETAIEIYRSNYWNAARCDSLPPGLDLCVFDFGVNAGVRTAVRLLQEIVGVTQDGSIGPVTLAAVAVSDTETVIRRYAEKRLDYYRSLPDFDAFGRGWTDRTITVRDTALRMVSDAKAALVPA